MRKKTKLAWMQMTSETSTMHKQFLASKMQCFLWISALKVLIALEIWICFEIKSIVSYGKMLTRNFGGANISLKMRN